MRIERITEENAGPAGEIYLHGWQEGYRGIVPQSFLDDLTVEMWRPRLTAIWQKGFLLSDHARYVAAVAVSAARDDRMTGWGEIMALYVRPDCFRRGYGKTLFSYAKEQLNRDGFDHIYLWVLEKNFRARSFYEAMGFCSNGDVKDVQMGDAVLREIRYTNTT